MPVESLSGLPYLYFKIGGLKYICLAFRISKTVILWIPVLMLEMFIYNFILWRVLKGEFLGQTYYIIVR
jgi:hypothetical protein